MKHNWQNKNTQDIAETIDFIQNQLSDPNIKLTVLKRTELETRLRLLRRIYLANLAKP